MATLGNTSTPSFGWNQFSSTANQAAESYTVPTGGGVFSSVSFYGSGDGASSNTAYGCIWSSGGTLLAQGSGVNTTGGSGSGGGQAWHTDTLTSPLFIAGGTVIYIGWQRSTATTFDWSFASTGSAAYHTAGNTPSNFGTSTTAPTNGTIGAYATYTPGGGYVNTGPPAAPVWTAAEVLVNTGTPAAPVWTPATGTAVNTGTPAAPVWTTTS